MRWRVKLLFGDRKEPLFSLSLLEKPTEESCERAKELYEADSYEIIESHSTPE